jgi:hypothetical protein
MLVFVCGGIIALRAQQPITNKDLLDGLSNPSRWLT